ILPLALTLVTDGSGISPPARSGVWFRTRTHMGQASGLLMWVTGPHKPEAASGRLACCMSPRACQVVPYRSLLARSQRKTDPGFLRGAGEQPGPLGVS